MTAKPQINLSPTISEALRQGLYCLLFSTSSQMRPGFFSTEQAGGEQDAVDALNRLKDLRNTFLEQPTIENGAAFLTTLEKQVRNRTNPDATWHVAAKLARQCGFMDLWEDYIEYGVRAFPYNEFMLGSMAEVLLLQGSPQESLNHARKALAERPEHGPALAIAAQAAFTLYDRKKREGLLDEVDDLLDEAMSYAENALRVIPQAKLRPEFIAAQRNIRVAVLEADGSPKALEKAAAIRKKMGPLAATGVAAGPGA